MAETPPAPRSPRRAAAHCAQLCDAVRVPHRLLYPRVPRVSVEIQPAKRRVQPGALPWIQEKSCTMFPRFHTGIKGVWILLYNVRRLPSFLRCAISCVTAVYITPEITWGGKGALRTLYSRTHTPVIMRTKTRGRRTGHFPYSGATTGRTRRFAGRISSETRGARGQKSRRWKWGASQRFGRCAAAWSGDGRRRGGSSLCAVRASALALGPGVPRGAAAPRRR